jgi:uncharacterized RDD family membrane protein YckC
VFDSKNRGLHDIICRTVVIKRDAGWWLRFKTNSGSA